MRETRLGHELGETRVLVVPAAGRAVVVGQLVEDPAGHGDLDPHRGIGTAGGRRLADGRANDIGGNGRRGHVLNVTQRRGIRRPADAAALGKRRLRIRNASLKRELDLHGLSRAHLDGRRREATGRNGRAGVRDLDDDALRELLALNGAC